MNMVCHGCTPVLPPKFDAAETARLVESEKVTFMATVPTVARLLLPEIDRGPGRFSSLRTLVATGEAFPVALKRRLRDAP
jgi:long-chain acyl-CoA synthetase